MNLLALAQKKLVLVVQIPRAQSCPVRQLLCVDPKKTASGVFGAMAKVIAKTVSSELSIFNSNTDSD